MVARVLVVSEDSGKQGIPTVQMLLKHAARLAIPGLDTRRLDARPLLSGDRSLNAVRGNAWKDKRPTPEKLGLIRTVANELAQGHFVVFHVDSDTVWSRLKSSDNRKKFETIVRNPVKQFLMSPGARPNVYQPKSDAQATALVGNLFAMHPCYSIESWLYQATLELKAQCRAVHDDVGHQELIDSWAADRALLDEVERPKDEALASCVKDRHNEALAPHFPAADVHRAERSWHEFVELLRTSDALRERLTGP